MKTLRLRMVFLIAILLTSISGYGQLTVTSGLTAIQYVDFLVGTGITYSNVVYTGDPNSIGKFTTGATSTNLGLFSGIIISSGFVNGFAGQSPIGSQVFNELSEATTGGSDADLLNLSSASSIENASILQFDFIPVSDTIKFRYVFGSEEYMEYVNDGYNDVFGFFISGPNPSGGTYSNRNIALIPGTTLPVIIDNVNTFSHNIYYVDNEGLGGTSIIFDGFTTVLTAWACVTPCAEYHIKLAVGDASDEIVDSGVFLEANSFSSNILNVTATYPNNSLVGPYSLEGGCNDASLCFTLNTPLVGDVTINYTISGTAVNGVDYLTIPDSLIIPAGTDSVCLTISPLEDFLPEGMENVVFEVQSQISCALIKDTISIPISDYNSVVAGISADTTVCDINIPISASGSQGIPPYTYAWDNGLLPLSSQLVSPVTQTTYIVTVTDFCNYTASADVVISIGSLSIDLGPDISVCQGQSAVLSSNWAKEYLWSTGDTTQSISVSPFSESQYAVFAASGLCEGRDTILVHVDSLPIVSANGDPFKICKGDTVALFAWGADRYVWTSLPKDMTLEQDSGVNNYLTVRPTTTTTYIATGYTSSNCSSSSTIQILVIPSPVASFFTQPPIASSFDPTFHFYDHSQGNPVLWRWELSDGSTYHVPEFIHQFPVDEWGKMPVFLYVENADGCSDSIIQMVTIKPDYTLYIPNAISPNGDDINDRFHISGINIPNEDFHIKIYDRWGKQVFASTIPSFEWDGTCHGEYLPTGCYVYRIFYRDTDNNFQVVQGNITLFY